ncbi:MAG TPA: murein biosynthesis integral membrane protein MurJ, partial [Kofleriaceae bacterium]|nr:murein biosynthesis integral membrane protein MurJ [Kofleriaceae bacterium]
LARAAGLISSATLLSRLLGLVREQLFAALLGASRFADAFNIAFRIPNLLRDLFAEGALSQAFVPTFKATLKNDGEEAAYLLANRVAGTLLVVLGAIIAIAAIAATPIVELMAGDFHEIPGKFELTVTLTRVMLPFLPIISVAAVAMGMLTSRDRYATPALAPAMFNVASIAVGALLYIAGVSGAWVAIGWSVGTVLGGLCQLGIQMPALWRLGFRPRLKTDLRLRGPGTRRIAMLMVPAIGGLAAVQVNIFINSMFAASEPGAVSWLAYAFRLLQLPIGVFGVAIATVSTTRFSDHAADGDRPAIGRQLEESLRLTAFLTIPATVGLIVMAEPVIRLLFERGRFSASDTLATAAALRLYVIGLAAYASVKVIAPAYYAIDRARVPVISSMTAVAGNLAISIALHHIYGYRILALGTAMAAILNFSVLIVTFSRMVAPVRIAVFAAHLARVSIAATVMGVIVWLSHGALAGALGTAGLGVRLVITLGPIIAGAVIYAIVCHLLGVAELAPFVRRLRRKR